MSNVLGYYKRAWGLGPGLVRVLAWRAPALGSISSTNKLDMIAHAQKPTVWVAEAGGSGGQGRLWLLKAFEVSLGHGKTTLFVFTELRELGCGAPVRRVT